MELVPHTQRPTCRISIKGYIERILTLFGHNCPTKPQLSPHKHREIYYGAKLQEAPEEVTIPLLDSNSIKRHQDIVVSVLFCVPAVYNKVVLALNSIGTQQATATESTNDVINHLLYYLATYPNNGIV